MRARKDRTRLEDNIYLITRNGIPQTKPFECHIGVMVKDLKTAINIYNNLKSEIHNVYIKEKFNCDGHLKGYYISVNTVSSKLTDAKAIKNLFIEKCGIYYV